MNLKHTLILNYFCSFVPEYGNIAMRALCYKIQEIIYLSHEYIYTTYNMQFRTIYFQLFFKKISHSRLNEHRCLISIYIRLICNFDSKVMGVYKKRASSLEVKYDLPGPPE